MTQYCDSLAPSASRLSNTIDLLAIGERAMNDDELLIKEQENAHRIYAKYGDNEQALSQAIWKDLKNIATNRHVEGRSQFREELENTFLEQLSKESHNHHKKVFIEFSNPYNQCDRDKQHAQIGTSRGYWKDHSAADMKPVDYPIKVVNPAGTTKTTRAELTISSGWRHSSGPESFEVYDEGRKKFSGKK